MLQSVIVAVAGNWDSVHRLVDYCAKLDGTEVRVIHLRPEDDAAFIPQYPQNAKACRASFSLHFAAKAMAGQSFIWLEHDSIPLKPGWAEAISKEYDRLGKPFMLSSDSHPPHDLVGGIGVYGPDTHWMIPQNFRKWAWDLWMIQNLGPLISRTPLIQHSYGVYSEIGICTEHKFPRDAGMLRNDALIFHRDAQHYLLQPNARSPVEKVFYHSGDLGDIIYHFETIRRLGGGRLMLGSDLGLGAGLPTHCREPMTGGRVENLKPLAMQQPYIRDVQHWKGKPDPAWINLNLFRETYPMRPPNCRNLQRASLRRFGLPVQDETKPWLSSTSESGLDYKIAIARSPRYHNDQFPWKKLVERYSAHLCFCGPVQEKSAFEAAFGDVTWWPTHDLAMLARAITKAQVFIGNQSCPYAIAEGLKKPCVQETWGPEPNCLFERPNVLNNCTDFERICKFVESYL